MLNKICLLILLQLWCMINLVFAESITIVVVPETRVEGAVITLGQIAEISGEDSGRVRSLEQLKLGNAPLPGGSLVLTKDLLNMRLANTGADLTGIAWKIPDSVLVTASSQSISRQTLIDKAIATTRAQAGLNVGNGDIIITPNGNVSDLLVPVGNIQLVATMPYGIRYNMPTSVIVTVNVNGQQFTKVPINMDVKQYREVIVSADQINLNGIFSAGNLRYERMDIGKLSAGYFTDINKVVGLASRRALKPGMVINDSMVIKPILIKRGAIVNIVARVGGLEVTAMGQAMQDGSEGQLIRVQNVNSFKFISARVLDGSTVQVLTYKSR